MESWEALEEKIAQIGCEPGLGPVRGAGERRARLVLVGEAPGETEVREGRPFAGAAGRILDRALEAAGIERADIWITNVVKCRPVREAGGRRLNRAPSAAEVRLWKPVLAAELALIAPRLIVCLGAVAAKALIDPRFAMQRQRGEWFSLLGGIEATATYHPAFLYRLQGDALAKATASLADDLRAARRHRDAESHAAVSGQPNDADLRLTADG
jgi:uracil-DNA glycosylase family 4